jgi:hypothetical protein
MSSVTDEEVRRLARTVWRGIEQGALRLKRAVQSPTPNGDLIDPDQIPSQIVGSSLMAAADHARTMAIVITEPRIGPSTATVARGALENFARIHWVSSGQTPDDVRARALHVLRKDVNDSKRASDFESQRPDRATLTGDEYIAAIKEHIDELAVPGLNWTISKALEEISIEKWPELEPKAPYSTLSAVAHGGLPGLGLFVVDNELRLPRQEVINQVGFVLGIADVAIHALQRCPLPVVPENQVHEQWEHCIANVTPAVRGLMAEDTAVPSERAVPGL